jgi:hypothetical protein
LVAVDLPTSDRLRALVDSFIEPLLVLPFCRVWVDRWSATFTHQLRATFHLAERRLAVEREHGVEQQFVD